MYGYTSEDSSCTFNTSRNYRKVELAVTVARVFGKAQSRRLRLIPLISNEESRRLAQQLIMQLTCEFNYVNLSGKSVSFESSLTPRSTFWKFFKANCIYDLVFASMRCNANGSSEINFTLLYHVLVLLIADFLQNPPLNKTCLYYFHNNCNTDTPIW